MPAQHIGDTLRDEGQGCVVAETQEDDSLMRLTEPKYQRTKVLIVGDQHASFSLHDAEHGSIWKAGEIICPDARDVVALLCLKPGQPRPMLLNSEVPFASIRLWLRDPVPR
jgi:hypothetical protein